MSLHNIFYPVTRAIEVFKEQELTDADLSAINGGALILLSGPLLSLGNIAVGSYNGGYNQTSNNQDGYTSVNSTNTSATNMPRN